MANHKSSTKRARQDKQKRADNRTKVSAARTAVKAVREALVKGEKTDIVAKLRTAQSRLMKGAKTKAVAKKSAARKISRLTKQVAALTK